jgi:hypothetical protein
MGDPTAILPFARCLSTRILTPRWRRESRANSSQKRLFPAAWGFKDYDWVEVPRHGGCSAADYPEDRGLPDPPFRCKSGGVEIVSFESSVQMFADPSGWRLGGAQEWLVFVHRFDMAEDG